MKKFIDLLAPLGLVVMVGSEAWIRAGKNLPGKQQAYLLAGAFLVVLHLILRYEDIAGRLGRRQMRYGANTFVLALVALGILGGLNYLVARRAVRWDLTKGQRFSLSDQTTKVVSGLKDDVKVTYFQRGRDLQRGQDRLK